MAVADRDTEIRRRLETLAERFPFYLQVFDQRNPFRRTAQLSLHARTITRRRSFNGVEEALEDDQFLDLLHQTLIAWGIGVRGSTLKPPRDFASALRRVAPRIRALDGLGIEEDRLLADGVNSQLWHLLLDLEVVTNKAVIVAGTKTLHHILPDLVVPIDRLYTGAFFRRRPPQFQANQEQLFKVMFKALHGVARKVQPQQYVGTGWQSSRTKVIDNAVVGFCLNNGLV